MGGVDDETEPATKRMKLSSGLLSNGSSCTDPALGPSIDLMARPLQSSGDEETVGSSGVIKRVELVRIITKALYSLGYEKSGAHLEEESGIALHSSVVNQFMQQIRDGDWDESVSTLRKINHIDENTMKSASFLILEQKFFEFIDRERVMDALKTLRTEITPLCINAGRVRELSSCMLSLVGPSNQNAKRTKSRAKLLEELQKLLPPTVMIPERRLEHLVEQALVLQRDTCLFHNSVEKEMSLYKDHHCGKDQLPSRTLQVLQAHTDEVWFLKFSHNGKYLASASTDKTAIIWEVDSQGVTLKHKLSGHMKPVSSVSWSPDDHQLLTCGVEESVRRWDVASGECLQVYEKSGGSSFVSCGWFPDGTSLCFGLTDKTILMWDMDGKELDSFKGHRTLKISDLEITSDGKHVISACRESAVLLLSVESRVERLIEEDQVITSFSLSGDDKHLLVNLLNEEIHLWNIEGDVKLVAKFKGHKRARFVIRSCFGGIGEGFIASGSEDSQVYIWHRASGELIEALPGHSGSVNCVAWNPKNPHMLASASDDRTIRIWGINDLKKKHNSSSSSSSQCNGVHYCNGST